MDLVAHERPHLLKRAGVEQQVYALAGAELAARVLLLDTFFAAPEAGFRAAGIQISKAFVGRHGLGVIRYLTLDIGH